MDSFDPDLDAQGEPREETAPIRVPWQHLSQEALHSVVESCLVAQLADQNIEGFDLQREMTKVLAGLDSGDWVLIYDPDTASPALRRPEELD